MRDNLIFHGIEETPGENCEQKLKMFIKDIMKIEKDIEFHRVHRLPEENERSSQSSSSIKIGRQ